MNGKDVRAVFEKANHSAGFRKVLACFSGHHHRDYVRQIRDIVYPQINSASYYWVGKKYARNRYSDALHAKFPYLTHIVPYKDPIYAVVTLDPTRGFLQIEGRKSEFVGPAPWDIGGTKESWDAKSLTAEVSGWKMPV